VGARFCDGCGRPLPRRAPGEGEAPAEPSDVATLGSPGPSPSQDRAPRDYTPKHLAEKILTSKSALEGERKQVTVLFADVKGSLDLAEQVDPEEWHRILNRFFEILSDGVHRFEGTVNQYTGDGIMALFGAPITHEDHAQRACYTALQLTEELGRYSEELKRTEGLNFAVRMGLNSGEVVVGKIGDDLRMDYTAQGHTVGLASRLEQLAHPGKIYLSENTAGLVTGFFRLRDLGAFELKGVRKPLHVYELEGVGEMRTHLDVSRARGLTRFVGRIEEMETLERALSRALEGNAQVIGVVAEAGVGKSRLCFEFVERCRAKGLRVRETHGVAHGKAIPFLPVLEFMRGFFGVTERDGDEEARRKIAGTLLLLDKALTDALPILFEFLGVPDPKSAVPRMDPEARQRQLFGLMKRVLQARNREEPGVALFEDLHWIDAGSEAFLENMVEALPGTRTLFLLNFRPEYQAGWMKKSYYQQLPLLPLGPAEIAEMLRSLLGTDPSLADLPERIQERTAGNPFFIEEVVQSLIEVGILEGARGHYHLSRPVEEVAIPASVQAVLGARIDRLAEREKHLLQTAAVIGKEFSEPVLRRVAELPDVDLADSLRVLTAAEFVYEGALYPDLEYAFKHPLTQEVAYRSQLADRRAHVHGAVAQAITELYQEKLDERAALVAHHWERAGEAYQAADWHRRAAEWAGFRDLAEAFRHWRQVRSLLEEVPESPETIGLGLMARMQILNFGWRLGLEEAESARVFAEGITSYYGAVKNTTGEMEEALSLRTEALRLAEQTGDVLLELGSEMALAYSLIESGRLREGLALADRAIARASDDPALGLEMFGFCPALAASLWRVIILYFQGRPKEALRDLDRTIQLTQEHGDTEVLGWAHGAYPFIALMTGDHRGALAHGRKAFEIAEKTGSTLSRILAQWRLGLAQVLNEEWQEARETLEAVLAIARETRVGLFEAPTLAFLAESYLALGEESRARETANGALTVARRCRQRVNECQAHLANARVLLATEGAKAREAIEATLAEAMTIVQEAGAKSQEPFIHEERAALARLLGDDATHQRELREAHRLFTEVEATGHAARLAKELGL
jgi:class 3 adenylate cyclase/tetratricopeptide (TPR) repeat protein